MDDITKSTIFQVPLPGFIENLLVASGHDAENPCSKERLLELSGCQNARELNHAIEIERLQRGKIVCSSRGGYFVPSEGEQGLQECLPFIRRMCGIGGSCFKIVKSILKNYRQCEGQTDFDSLLKELEETGNG